MSQRQWIVIVGVWVMIFPFLGFPSTWDRILAILTGLGIVAFAYRIHFAEIGRPADTFSDSAPASQSNRRVPLPTPEPAFVAPAAEDIEAPIEEPVTVAEEPVNIGEEIAETPVVETIETTNTEPPVSDSD